MRINWFAQAAACALLVTSVQSAADAKPKRPAASVAAKKKAAAAAAKKEADRLAAEAAAKAAAEAAEKARIRAQWGVLADLPDGDYDANGTLVTVRREDGGNKVALTVWKSMARLSYSFSRDPKTGALSYDYADALNKAHYDGRVETDGSIEAVMKNETSWPVLKREAGGVLNFAYVPGKKLPLGAVQPGSKAATKLASLVAAGKLQPAGAPDRRGSGANVGVAEGTAISTPAGIPSMATLQAAEGFEMFRKLEGDWWNGSVKWSIAPVSGAVVIDGSTAGGVSTQRKIELRDGVLLLDRSQAVPLSGGAYFPKRGYAVVRKDEGAFIVTAGKMKGGSFLASRDQSLNYLGEYRRMTPQMAETYRQQVKQYEVAQAEAAAARARAKASGGNSGWLGGLVMGGMAAAMGGDASMVMGAAMKGVEMTTDNEMTRNVLAGKGDEMIQSGIETKQMIAETERLRVAAAEETRRKREAEAATENARRVKEANDRQQAIADAYAAKRAAGEQASADKAAADKEAAARRLADQQKRDADAKAAEQEAAAKAAKDKRDAELAAEAEKRRKAEEQRLAELKRKEDEANRPIAMKEGVVLCEKKRENYYRCDGPLQVTYSDLTSPAGMASIGQACGSSRWRDMGMAGSYRAFGCNFGMNPDGIAPGNRDVPAAYGLFVERATFYCKRSIDAYCKTR